MFLERVYEVYLLGLALPFAVMVFLVLDAASKAAGKLGKKLDAEKRRREMLATLPEVFVRAQVSQKSPFQGYFEGQLKRAGWKISPQAFLAIAAILGFLGVAAGAFLLKSAAAAVATAIVAILIPFLALNWAVQRYEQKLIEQLPTAVHLFSVEHEAARSVPRALARASEGVGSPLSGYIAKCARDLEAGKRPKDVLERFCADLGCEYGRLWARLLLASYEDSTVVKLLPRLIGRLHQQRLLIQKNLTELSWVRRLGIILNVLAVPGFFLTQLFFPDSAGFYAQPVGRVVIIVLFLSVAAGIFLDYTLRKVEL